MKNIFVIIPTLNPNIEVLSKFIIKLQKEFKYILLFDDGCNDSYYDFFYEMEKKKILVLHHYKNLGKGRSLKDAFNYILVNYPNILGVVTADSDGQHSVDDIKNVAKEVLKNPTSLILGVRNFNTKNVPWHNKAGNIITRNIFKLFVGISVSDTQTGLRGLSCDVMNQFLDTKGERYEYENNQLISSIEKNIPIFEVNIKTIYDEVSKSESHFNPLLDSIAIYKTFIKYIVASLLSCVSDVLLFAIFNNIFSILISTIFARIISSIINFILNKKIVFKNSNKLTLYKYFLLVIIQMFMSGFITGYLANIISVSNILIKIFVDFVIFIVNYIVQKKFIFRRNYEK